MSTNWGTSELKALGEVTVFSALSGHQSSPVAMMLRAKLTEV